MSARKERVARAVRGLEPTLRSMLDGAGIPGCAIRVVFEDGDGLDLAVGRRSAAAGGEAKPDARTVFMIGSCSKAFTALCASILAARGQIDLDAPVSAYLSVSFVTPGGEPTLRQLLSNVSGIPNLGMSELVTGKYLYDKMPRGYSGAYPFGSAESAVAFVDGAELAAPPGELYLYSNEGFSLAAMALAAAAGRPFPDLVRDTVLEPLGMSASGYREEELPPRSAWADGHAPGVGPKAPYFEPAIAGAGGLCSTAEDMGRFVSALLNAGTAGGSALPAGAVRELEIGRARHRTAESLVGPGFGSELYGMGLMVYPDFHGTRALAHGGSTGHFSSSVFYDRELGFGVAGLCNSGNGEGALALFAFMAAAAALGKDPYSAFPGLALEGTLRRLEGDYASQGGAVSARISYGQGRLWWESTDGNGNSPAGARPLETRLGPSGPTFWHLNGPGAESEVFFYEGPDGLMRLRKDRNVLARAGKPR